MVPLLCIEYVSFTYMTRDSNEGPILGTQPALEPEFNRGRKGSNAKNALNPKPSALNPNPKPYFPTLNPGP